MDPLPPVSGLVMRYTPDVRGIRCVACLLPQLTYGEGSKKGRFLRAGIYGLTEKIYIRFFALVLAGVRGTLEVVTNL
jgi:hypothetical protein